ncbi:MAG: hypothetical protein IBJ18_01380 [Phycisphaerales bacterium]|nr:hypothetical protein [Phycisphaerales bacterium]
MRLPGRKIWRAFPELDAFDDARAAQYVRAASRAFWLVKLLRGAAMFLGGLACFTAMGLAGGMVMNTMERFIKEPILTLLVGLTAVVVGVVSMTLLMIVRDFFMRRRVRKVIASRGSCVKCGYVLVGLRVPDDLNLRCPECGTLTVLNLERDETALDAEGVHRRFLSRYEGAMPVKFWTPGRRRAATITAVISVVGPIVLALGWWGINEYRQARDAARAKALLESTYSFQRYYDSLLSESERGKTSESAFVKLDELSDLITKRERIIVEEAQSEPGVGSEAWPEYTLLWDESQFDPDTKLNEDDQLQQVNRLRLSAGNAKRVVDAILYSTETDQLANELINSTNFAVDASMPTVPSMDLRGMNISSARMVCRFAAGAMRTAIIRGDRARFMLWLRVAVRCAELCDRFPTLLTWLSASACDAQLNEFMLKAGIYAAPKEWFDEIAQILASGTMNRMTDREMFQGERIWSGEVLCGYFSQPKEIASLMQSSSSWGMRTPLRMGSLEENLAYRDMLESWYLQYLTDDRWDVTKPQTPLPPTDLVFGQGSANMVPRFAAAKVWGRLNRDVVLLALAIERYRRDEGKLPVSLDVITPKYIDRLPRDPLTGRVASYKQLPSQSDNAQPAEFVIYLWGDNQDDQGNFDLSKQFLGLEGLNLTRSGFDYRLYPYVTPLYIR